jgi:tetratricopeptide (TPR) repeat protein
MIERGLYNRAQMRMLSVITVFCLTWMVAGCSNPTSYYLSLSDEKEFHELHSVVNTETDPAARVIAVERLTAYLMQNGGPNTVVAYLTTYVEEHPDDPYGGYLLYLAAQTYLDLDAAPLALYYLERVASAYGEIVVQGRSIRQATLEQLARLSPSAERRVDYCRALINEYLDTENPGLLYYRLGNNLEELGEWEAAYDAYREFIRYPDTVVPGQPTAHRTTEQRIAFYDSSHDWTVPTLEELEQRITWALVNKDAQVLLRYQAPFYTELRGNVPYKYFFTRSWEQDFDDPNVSQSWNIGELLRLSRRITVVGLEVDADGDEAYLETFGWGGLRIRDWSLYFRRVYLPSDPEIHGSWEWAGIYLGRRL